MSSQDGVTQGRGASQGPQEPARASGGRHTHSFLHSRRDDRPVDLRSVLGVVSWSVRGARPSILRQRLLMPIRPNVAARLPGGGGPRPGAVDDLGGGDRAPGASAPSSAREPNPVGNAAGQSGCPLAAVPYDPPGEPFPHGQDNRDTLRGGRSLVDRLPLDIHATGSQLAGDASRGTPQLIVIRNCNSNESDLFSVDNRRQQPTA